MKHPNITFTITVIPEHRRIQFQATNEGLSKEEVLKVLDELRKRIHNDEYLTEDQGDYADDNFKYADKIIAEDMPSDADDELDELQAKTKARELFLKLEKKSPNGPDLSTITLMAKALKYGYQMAYDIHYTPMCDKCGYRSATCFGPGAFCDECSMEDFEENDEFDNDEFDDTLHD